MNDELKDPNDSIPSGNNEAVPPGPQEVIDTNPFNRMIGVTFSPGETFASINLKPTWLMPIVFIILISSAFGIFSARTLSAGYETFSRKALQKQSEKSGQDLAKPDVIRKVKLFYQGLAIGGPIFIIPIVFLVIAGILALGMMLMDARTTFKKIFSVVAWCMLPTSIIQYIVMTASLLVRDSESLALINPFQPETFAVTNLSEVLGGSTQGFIHSLLGSLDIFSFWYLFLLILGLKAISSAKRITQGTIAGFVIPVWVFFVLVKALLSMLQPK